MCILYDYSPLQLLCASESAIILLKFVLLVFSFEASPRHDAYVPKFEAELAHFCEKLVRFSDLVLLFSL